MFIHTKNLIYLVLFSSIFLFFTIGYWKSDARYYKQLLVLNKLETPSDIFSFLSKNYEHDKCIIVHTNAVPRHLLENHKRFWCDEGSTVLATLCYYAGFKTRLVRMINIKNIDNHTFLQINENGIWNNYDFSFQCINLPVDSVAKIAKIQLKDLRHYNYPRVYNKIINANYFLKQSALFLRGIKENDFVK